VISALSAPIAAAKCSMLYLSTFHSAYIMVLAADLQTSVLWLANAGYKVVTEVKNETHNPPSLETIPLPEAQTNTLPNSRRDSVEDMQFNIEV